MSYVGIIPRGFFMEACIGLHCPDVPVLGVVDFGADSLRFDLIWTDPWPYGKVVDIASEECPVLDIEPGLVDQS
ncbi:unnamed protein product [Penicillium salamii]|uniref:Uncharacterized protein n=1 Tax=Penicillium salamii TaxID=1612424 RepID=A0A9W4JMR9_9EURO|nr:unnamed protein product [Penicillium salamii]CAG8059668.1 unnamed protein product [Penicillium salamii]CAG8164253.1 unnamed protein product [Penicillium salamii]CAG8164273.1 unnamed protein product [Penicillium salamii]CAG8234681.1 unnamed protein product [Penicillium salamii]